MNVAQLIARKRDGESLSSDDIHRLVQGYTRDEVPDYQMSAWAMAVYFRGMDVDETAALTDAMLESGARFSWPKAVPARVDKHSTGGIGDKVSLPLVAVLAACGLAAPMISGRGLGPTGGTLDKLESIAGFRVDQSIEEATQIVEKVGCVICAASDQLAPADRKLYRLRDVTATVPSIPLITASIMSKKLAEGLDALVLDVKHGSGAFMKTPEMARQLARSLVDTGKRMGVATSALVTDMNQPLGRMVGNSLEVDESLDCLKGGGPDDLRQLVVQLGAELLQLANLAADEEPARRKVLDVLDSRGALEKFHEMVAAQHGDLNRPRDLAPDRLLLAESAGCVERIDAERLGWCVIDMGGGRRRLHDKIDHGVGIEMLTRIGDRLEVGQPLARLFVREPQSLAAEKAVRKAITIGENAVAPPPLIVARIA